MPNHVMLLDDYKCSIIWYGPRRILKSLLVGKSNAVGWEFWAVKFRGISAVHIGCKRMSCFRTIDLSGGILVDLEPVLVLAKVNLGSSQGDVEVLPLYGRAPGKAVALPFGLDLLTSSVDTHDFESTFEEKGTCRLSSQISTYSDKLTIWTLINPLHFEINCSGMKQAATIFWQKSCFSYKAKAQ